MAIVESSKEYVLHWTGHAAHVTERFSGLLARQALVDVTLICQGQKLRVHKLVLASSSLYFEEMLEQDLGQEPIILLRDLDFEVLKAMIEFMYCGETTISECHLRTLLDAAQVFKVKELKRIIESMIKSKFSPEKVSSDAEVSFPTTAKKKNYKERSSSQRCDKRSLPRDLEESEISESKCDRTLDNNTQINDIDEDNFLYEVAERVEEQLSAPCDSVLPLEKISLDGSDGAHSQTSASEEGDGMHECTNDLKISCFAEDNPTNSLRSETDCCKCPNGVELRESSLSEITTSSRRESQEGSVVGECSRVYAPKKRKCPDNDEYTDEEMNDPLLREYSEEAKISTNSPKSQTSDKALGKHLKVYMHKRCKSLDEKRSQILDKLCDSREDSSLGTSSIDLNDVTPMNDTPIDISTANLDMETSEYIWNLSTETIQYVVGCTINTTNSSATINNERRKNSDSTINDSGEVSTSDPERSVQMKELYRCENSNGPISEIPVLRRSVRINQSESDDSLNNNTGVTSVSKGSEKSLDPERENYATKTRRRGNRDNFRVMNENVAENSPSRLEKNVNSRSLRSATKLSSRSSKISRNGVAAREERTKSARHNRDKLEKNSDSPEIMVNTRLNTIASVDRALWGDMSDVLENRREASDDSLNCTTSREIPFALGLLPLRAALERMQATVDHQPRKTRSSVTPWRQEVTTNQRRKFHECENSQRKHLDGNVETAVCHIEIRTSPSRNEIREPRLPAEEKRISVGTNADSNGQ